MLLLLLLLQQGLPYSRVVFMVGLVLQEREYARALVATKLSKMFGKPFLAALEGHTDGVKTIVKARTYPVNPKP